MCAGEQPSAGRSQPRHIQHTAHMWTISYIGREMAHPGSTPPSGSHLPPQFCSFSLLLTPGLWPSPCPASVAYAQHHTGPPLPDAGLYPHIARAASPG